MARKGKGASQQQTGCCDIVALAEAGLDAPGSPSSISRWLKWAAIGGAGLLGLWLLSRTQRAKEIAKMIANLLPVRGIEKVSDAFKQRVAEIAVELGADPNHLMAVMSFESGLSPSIRNKASGATGLIQFMGATARWLGTTVDHLASLSAEDQLEWVRKYFLPYKGRLKTLTDTYMAVLWPAAIGRGGSFVLFRSPSQAYEQNKGLDRGGKGYVTAADAASHPQAILDAAARAVG